MPVEKIADAFILTLLIEVTMGVGLQRINRGGNLLAIFETILLVLLAPFHGQAYSHEGGIRGGENVESRSQTPRDHTIRLLEIPCGDKL